MADVVQVDFWEAGGLGEPLESLGDGVGVGWLAVLPAEQPAVIVVVGAELLALLVEQLDVIRQNRESEWVERQEVLGVLGLAVRFDQFAVDDTCVGPMSKIRLRAGEVSGAQRINLVWRLLPSASRV